MNAPRHLLAVWNPSYTRDVMDQHLGILLEWADRWTRGEAGAEDVYVWWAKLRSPRREEELPHLDDVLAVQEQVDQNVETHLYLTDYRSLYVAHLAEVTADEVLEETPREQSHAPEYYPRLGYSADFWFRLFDVRRLVADDTPATIEELKRLHNVHYHGHPVSLYGGIVDLPLVVTRDDERQWFDDRDLMIDGRLWAQEDADRKGETERIARDLRDNLFGRAAWGSFEIATRSFLAAAEATYRARRDDPRYDFTGPAMGYAKALETELNALVFGATRKALADRPPADRETRIDGRAVNLGGRVPHQSLGAMRVLLEKDVIARKALEATLGGPDARWLTGELPGRLKSIVEFRNPAAHDATLDAETVERKRGEILGVGHEGMLVRIARAKMRAG